MRDFCLILKVKQGVRNQCFQLSDNCGLISGAYHISAQQLRFHLQEKLYCMGGIIFGYWKMRGYGQYLRHLLTYTETEFTEVQYDKREKWFDEDKKSLGFDFPNLPYLIDGDLRLTESLAIARYVIKRSGKVQLLGKDALDQAKVNNLLGVFLDFWKVIRALATNNKYQEIKAAELDKVRSKLQSIKQFVGEKPFALGYLTLFDFYISELLYHFETIYPNERKNYAFWWRIRENFERLPEIQAYYKRPDAISEHFLPPTASISIKKRKVTYGYWGVRGFGQIQRLLLAYSGVEFQDKYYVGRDTWFNGDKLTLGQDFPNIPYLYDGNNNITESAAIQRYIIERWGKKQLLGKDFKDYAKIQSFLSVFTELAAEIKGLFFNKDYKAARVPVLEKYSPKFAQLNLFVGQKEYVLGYLTLADFVVAEESHFIQAMYPEEYTKWPFLQRVRQSFDRLPEIVAYYQKPTAFKGRFFPQQAALSVEK